MPSLFSIIIPVHNRQELLGRTLESVRNQTFNDFEVLIVDDGSTDETPSVIERFSSIDSRFRGIAQGKSGVSAARNKGIREASGEWIVFLDSDDLFFEYTLSTFQKWIRENPSADVVGGYTEHIDTNDDVIELAGYENWDAPDSYGLRVKAYEECIRKYGFLPGMYAFRRTVLKDEIRFDESLSVCEDYDFMLRLLKTAVLYRDPMKVHRYRWHEGQTEANRFSPVRLRVAERHLFEDSRDPRFAKDSSVQSEWYHRMADDYYSLGESAKARRMYLKSVGHNPSKLSDRKVIRQIMATTLPGSVRESLKRMFGASNSLK
jgi:glycosyltransferase involved in cell wall biosynthesis